MGTDFHIIVFICAVFCDNLCLLCRGGMRGIQPERLNAEGDSPSALSRGLSVSATPGKPSSPPRKASERRESSRRGSRYSRSSHYSERNDTEGYASLHPRLRATRSALAFDLSGRAAVIGCGKLVIIIRGRAACSAKNICEICVRFNHLRHVIGGCRDII